MTGTRGTTYFDTFESWRTAAGTPSGFTRNSVTAFTGPSTGSGQGYAVLPFTYGLNGSPYSAGALQGWQYTSYNYTDSAHKHAVTSLQSGETYSYDANGNMTTRVEGGVTYTQEFDIENRLIKVTVNSQVTEFIYDGDGNLIKKKKPDNTSTVYIGGVYEVDLNGSGSATKKTSYYPAGGAMRVEVVGTSNTLYFMLRDHLGSASVTLDASGNIVTNGEQRYYPFGESRIAGTSLPTDRLYTGQRDVGLGGLYHYNARFYLPKLGRFVSADSIVPQPFNPQSLNRFSYVLNNPLRYADPTGHTSACAGPARAAADVCADYRPTPKPQQGGGKIIPFTKGSDLGANCCITIIEPDPPPIHCDFCRVDDGDNRCCITIVEPNPPVILCDFCQVQGGWLGEGGWLGPGIFGPPGYDRCKDRPLMFSAIGCEGPQIIATQDEDGDGTPTIPLIDLILGHSEETIVNSNSQTLSDLKALSDSELLQTVYNPTNGDFVQVNSQTGVVVDGNTRVYELRRRADDPYSTISWDTPIPFNYYTSYDIGG